jgi:hypothetical protein
VRSCTYPSPSNVLTRHCAETLERSKSQPPRLFCDDFLELLRVIKKRWCAATGCMDFCFFSRPTYEGNNNWRASFGKYERRGDRIEDVWKASSDLGTILNMQLGRRIRGNFYYPPGGYREWHTNKYDAHGWRMYLVHTRNIHDENIISDADSHCAAKNEGAADEATEVEVTSVGAGRVEPADFAAAAAAEEREAPQIKTTNEGIDEKENTRQRTDRCAFFRYKHPVTGEVHTCADFDGCVRLFRIGAEEQTIWHTIYSEGDRWSLGYILSNQAATIMLEQYGSALVSMN